MKNLIHLFFFMEMKVLKMLVLKLIENNSEDIYLLVKEFLNYFEKKDKNKIIKKIKLFRQDQVKIFMLITLYNYLNFLLKNIKNYLINIQI